nr:zinc finger BED domain-containing protein RICESLEEPER 2 [Tanacetum cinerariifolium]
MADHTMEELLQAPTEGYGEATVILKILAENFEMKTNFASDVLNDAIKLMLFPYSLEGAAKIWAIRPPRPFKDSWHNSSIVRRSRTGRSLGPSTAISKSFKRVGSVRDLIRMLRLLMSFLVEVVTKSAQTQGVDRVNSVNTELTRVLSNKRTKLTSASLEMCICLKYHLDATKRIQHTSNIENTLNFEEAVYDEEVQAGEAISLYNEEISQDEVASEARRGGVLHAYNGLMSSNKEGKWWFTKQEVIYSSGDSGSKIFGLVLENILLPVISLIVMHRLRGIHINAAMAFIWLCVDTFLQT